MDFIDAIKARLPDYAKDVRLTLDAVLLRSSLEPRHAAGAALAAAFASRSPALVEALRDGMEPAHAQAAQIPRNKLPCIHFWMGAP